MGGGEAAVGGRQKKQEEIEALRMNEEDLQLKLKEAVDAHDQTALASREQERLMSSLVSEAEHVNELVLGMKYFLSSFPCSWFF